MTGPATPLHIRKLIGHDDAWASVSDAWESGRFAHAWLITGPKGIGKASFAFTLAKAILSTPAASNGLFAEAGAGAKPKLSRDLDGNSPVLHRIESSAHPDILVVEKGWSDDKQTKRRTEIVIDDVRAVGSFLSMTPAEGGWRVVVVDAVDEMNRNAANALLKNLEEPPKNTVLLLVAHNPGRLLPTIRSRCRRLSLMPLSETEMEEGLTRHLPESSAQRCQNLARLAQGSLGEAISLAEMDGDSMAAEISALLEYWPKLNIPQVLEFASKVSADPERFRLFSVLLGDWLANTMKRGAGVTVPGYGNTFVQSVPLEQWFEVWEKVSELFRKTDAVNLDRRQVVISVFHAVVSPAAT
jgi:DNA polymerase-3 subunit delta'